jgi:hypothetical protein
MAKQVVLLSRLHFGGRLRRNEASFSVYCSTAGEPAVSLCYSGRLTMHQAGPDARGFRSPVHLCLWQAHSPQSRVAIRDTSDSFPQPLS